MSIVKKYIYLLVTVVCLASCDDFLNIQPTDSANADGAIATTHDAQVAINGIMRAMTADTYYGRDMMMYADAKGGDMTIISNGNGLSDFYTFDHSPVRGSYSSFWSHIYYCIMQVNNLLESINHLEAEGKNGFESYKGQALTLRALFYFDLVRLYGLPYNYLSSGFGVPRVMQTLGASAQPVRATVAQNYADICRDLQAAELLLADDIVPKHGYVNYYANLALQARVALYMEDYELALEKAEKIIVNQMFYRLYTNDEWAKSWSQQFGDESILELCIDSENDLGTSSLGYYHLSGELAKTVVARFVASDYYLQRLAEDPTDVRWSVMTDDEKSMVGARRLGACLKYTGGPDMQGDGKPTMTATNIKIIRLSEVYLIAAEAALQSGDKGKAADYLNFIRSRAPMLQPATADNITLDMILNERSKELYGEGQRFFDRIRCNQTIEYNDDFQNVPVTRRGKTIDRTYYGIVLPISQDELNANPAMANQQNSGY